MLASVKYNIIFLENSSMKLNKKHHFSLFEIFEFILLIQLIRASTQWCL